MHINILCVKIILKWNKFLYLFFMLIEDFIYFKDAYALDPVNREAALTNDVVYEERTGESADIAMAKYL